MDAICNHKPKVALKEHLGKYLFKCLQERDKNDIVSIFAPNKKILTRRQLLEDSIKAAATLKKLGLKRGDVISVVIENTLDYYMILLACLYMGVTLNPLNPSYLTAELRHALLISKPKVVISSDTAIELLIALKKELKVIKEVVLLGSRSERNDVRRFEDIMKNVREDIVSFKPEELDYSNECAFILLSSGTTGLPKGVPLTHQNIEESLCCLCAEKYIGITPTDVTFLVVPLFHIFGIIILISGIISSSKVILLQKFKPDIFLESIEEYRITNLFFVPPLLLFFARSPLVQNYDIVSVDKIVVGGACLSKDLKDEFKKKFQNIALYEIYGATETGGVCAIQMPQTESTNSVGVLISNVECKVWDRSSKESLSASQTGELCFRGPMVIKGYLSRDTPTEKCLDHDGFWHSGDLGYFDEQGRLYIVDRIKDLIKYKGFQVPPAELEALIITHPKVKECGVIGIPDTRCGQLPLAYVVIRSNTSVTKQEIIDFVAERISVQKRLYGGVLFVNEIPKSASGKILHWKLVELYKKSLSGA